MPEVPHHKGSLFYQKTGSGNNVVLWFHGFGQQHQVFDKIVNTWQVNGTHYSFDLFFHGKSNWVSDIPTTHQDLQTIFQQFLTDNNINRFSIVAFSIGCRFAFSLTKAFPDKIQNLILLAPDGIQFRFWYWLATYPAVSRKIFKRIVSQPAWWHRLLSILEFTHIVDKKLLRFAQRQMDGQQKREQVYNTWVNFRHLKTNTKTLTQLMHTHRFSITLIAGSRDKLVPARLVKKLKNYIADAPLHVFDTHHNDLIEASQETIFKVLNNQ
ncbi:MAG: alpha/beta hydrolase [Cyclobacteriaceae bacterium]|nr:alpha/beta hydrolase [Cyclobacteriaceae bacterium]